MGDARKSQLRFDDRVAVVAGAGRGIGRADASALAERGAKVLVNDLGCDLTGASTDPSPARAVAAEIVAAGGDAVANDADVSSESGAQSIVADAIERYGRVDIVVNNAGNLAPDSMPSLTVQQLERHLEIHITGSFNVTRAAWEHMASAGYGRVVMTTSIGFLGGPFLISYSTAKGGVVSLGRSLALAGIEQGIKVNLLAPVAETRMVTDPDMRARVSLPPLPPDAVLDRKRAPELVSPMMLVLAHEACPVNGEILGAGLGRWARFFLAETKGVVAPDLDAEGILERWDEILSEDGYMTRASTKDAIDYRERAISEA